MDEQQLDQIVKARTGGSAGGTTSRLELPPDLLEQAVGRLTIVVGAFGLVMLGSIVLNSVLHLTLATIPLPSVALASRIGGAVAAVGMIGLLRSRGLSPQRKCDLGLGFEVLGAAGIVLFELSMMPAIGVPIGHFSAAAIWILLFRLIVPAPPLKALGAALGSAAAVPLVVGLLRHTALGPSLPPIYPIYYLTSLGSALVATALSVHIYRLGRAVGEARRLGSYHLEELLGAGGMGEVWRGSHARLKRPAAIKLIKPETLGGRDDGARTTALQRFEREAQATAELGSPHTVTVYDFGRTRDGTFYLVMELLDGFDLETLVEQHGPLPPERVVHLLAQACHSLMDAHRRGLVHRDVKPANIFACRLGPDVDFVKVLDFGLVKHIEPEESDEPGLTREGVVTGTPAYMPPEVALGSEPTDERADIYMLGCVAYWLLTGKLVFDGANAVALISNHIHAEPVPPSRRLDGGLPAGLEGLVMSCLAKDPADRPETVDEIRSQLLALAIEPPWTQARATAWWDEHHSR